MGLNTFENLTGRVINGLRVQAIARRQPTLAWGTICTRCQTAQVHRHDVLQSGNASCGNAVCGRTTTSSPSSLSVATAVMGERIADSAERIAFEHSQQPSQPVTDPTAAKHRAERMEANRIEAERLREEYKKYFFHQLRYPDSEPMSLQQWFDAGDTSRARILAIISKDDSGSA